jgi:hypothetical protein
MSQPELAPVGTDGDLDTFKDYLSEPQFRIRLDDQVNAAVRAALAETSGEKFPPNTQIIGEEFAARLAAYEAAVRPLQAEAALLGKWATPEQLPTLTNILARMSDGRPRDPGIGPNPGNRISRAKPCQCRATFSGLARP